MAKTEKEYSVAGIRDLCNRPSRVHGSDTFITSTQNTSLQPETVLVDWREKQVLFSTNLRGVIINPRKKTVVVIYQDGDGRPTTREFNSNAVRVALRMETLSAYDIRSLMRRPPSYDPGAEVRAFMEKTHCYR